ncbi:hypothetical protein BGY98DRAFT_203110 [Russula aff. rugulosa BPL654]|nr:hypothetical protein BGY98DRAFT_203110 [Russula aff. rugulosa BPL654]
MYLYTSGGLGSNLGWLLFRYCTAGFAQIFVYFARTCHVNFTNRSCSDSCKSQMQTATKCELRPTAPAVSSPIEPFREMLLTTRTLRF